MSRKRSSVWLYFSEIPSTNQAKCTTCQALISIKGGATNNLARHMKAKHPTIQLNESKNNQQEDESVDDVTPADGLNREEQQPSASTSSTGNPQSSSVMPIKPALTKPGTDIRGYCVSTKPLSISTTKMIHKQIIRFITAGYHPFSIIEEEEFRTLLSMLNPKYSLPSRKTLSNTFLDEEYNNCLESLKKLVLQARAIALTTDGWTNDNNVSFYAVTAHFLNENYELQSLLLACEKFEERHTADNIATFLKSIVIEWRIENKITVVVTDNAANIVAAIRKCGWRHIGCFAHTLNLIVQAALEDVRIKPILRKVKDIVEYFKRSSSALAKLTAHLKQNNMPVIKLKQDCPTRWNSTLDMIRRILQLKDAIAATTALLRMESNDAATRTFYDNCKFTDEEVAVLKQVTQIFTPFEAITEQISAEKYVTSSSIIPFIKILYSKLNHFFNDVQLLETRFLLQELKKNFDGRFPAYENNDLLCHSTFLDPRYKKVGFREESKFVRTGVDIQHRVVTNMNEHGGGTPTPTVVNANEEEDPLWNEFDDEVRSLSGGSVPGAGSIIETDKYKNEPLINRSEDPLKYWIDRKAVYPRLFQLVTKRFHIPATSVPCERIFSKTGDIMTKKRNRLHSDKLKKIVFLKHNKKFLK